MGKFSEQSSGSWEGVSPAKVNLYLAVTGKREDGFHDLVSLVAQLAWGDHMRIEVLKDGESDSCQVDDPECPSDASNLAFKAISVFRQAVPSLPPISVAIQKRIPMGAGLGGGSSNASTCLKALNALMGEPLNAAQLIDLAASLGSDCPVFLTNAPTWMRGRGEVLSPASPALIESLRGRTVTLIRPPFAVETPWAYRKLAERGDYRDSEWAERDAFVWNETPDRGIQETMFNSFESPLKEKFIAYIALFQGLSSRGIRPMISGSGSVCFFLSDGDTEKNETQELIKSAWGAESILAETILA